MSPDEAKERLRLDLESQARMQLYREAISKLRATLQIDILLEEPRLPVSRESNAPSIGLKEAPVMIIEFSDFQCPFCRNSQLAIKQVLQKYKKEVRLVFKNLPLESHSQAFSSAQAAFCAGEKGAFWQYHDALFASEDLSPDALNKLASSLHLDLSEFTACMKSEASRMAVQRDINEAQRFGINSTPTFIINGRLFRGALSFEDFKTAIERELKSSQRDSRNQ
jgi:protein-disulfide isomerase